MSETIVKRSAGACAVTNVVMKSIGVGRNCWQPRSVRLRFGLNEATVHPNTPETDFL